MKSKKIIVALTGASGIDYGIEVIKALSSHDVETHVIISKWAKHLIENESFSTLDDFQQLPDHLYKENDMSAAISSSSTIVDGMVVIPATVKTVSNIATANTGNLISRAADIMLKMRKPLIIGIRETPLSPGCLHNLNQLSLYGAIIFPLSPGFYHQPKTIQDLFDFISGKILDCFNIPNDKYTRWNSVLQSE
ncbi:MAG: UbiX family flavin prenyltransferase [Candidatus Hodarchaeales archaeon]